MINLDILNGPQREAVLHVDGPVLVLAGAGSGKTRVLTHRTAYLIDEADVNPWNILAITFTNKAAREMRERIDNLVDYGAENVTVSTFHSLCLRILFRHADKLGWDTNFEICDASDQKSVIKDVCKRLQIDTKSFKERTLIGAISSAKDELINTVDYTNMARGDFRKEITARVYDEYQKTLKKNNSFDFDDLIMKTVELFRTHPDVLDYYQERFKYIMVDEYQDTNTAQFELIHLLSMKYRNLCVVGDDDQSIYRFRGANIHNILDFEQTYPEAVVIRLEQNYRSSGNILEAANEVISNNRGRKVKRLWTEAEEGSKIHFRQLDTAAGEAMFVAEDIKKRVERDGINYGDCAILMRTNIQSKELEDAFRLLRIDYELVKGLKFWDTKVVKDLTSYLLTVASGVNDMRTNRIINVPKRGIGNASVDKVMSYAIMRGIPLVEACELADDVPGLGKSAEKIKNFAYMIYRLRSKMETLNFAQLLDEIIAETEYREYMDKEAETPEKFQEMLDYVDKLKEALTVYEESTEHPDLVDFMRQNGVEGNNISSSGEGGEIEGALTAEEERELRERRVLIMTMHNAKGLEFPYVYLVGMEDGLFPSYMTITGDDPEEMEEERRLCYVALTRAKEQLTITSARQRMVNGETRFSKTSRFVKEIPFGLLDMKIPDPKIKDTDRPKPSFKPSPAANPGFGKAFPMGGGSGYGSLDNRTSGLGKRVVAIKKGSQIAEPVAPDYGAGDRVRHIKFGDGTVESVSKGNRDYEVVVNFDEYGVKRMFAGFAKLVKI